MGFTNRAFVASLMLIACLVAMVASSSAEIAAAVEETDRGQQQNASATDPMSIGHDGVSSTQYISTDGALDFTDKPLEPIDQQQTTQKTQETTPAEMGNAKDEVVAFEVRFFRGLTCTIVLLIYTGLIGTGLFRLLGNYSDKFRL